MKEIPRMRTAAAAYEELKQTDPNTYLTLRALQGIIKRGEIPVLKIGSKNLIDMNNLYDYIHNPKDTAASSADYGKIRRIG